MQNYKWRPTCSQEHDFVLSVLCRHPVHHNLGQGVVSSDPCEERPAGQRVDGPVHERVEPDEGDHLVREVFGGLDLGVVGLAGTLMNGTSSDELLLMNTEGDKERGAAQSNSGSRSAFAIYRRVSPSAGRTAHCRRPKHIWKT